MDGAVVLEEFAEAGAAESAVGAWFFRGRGYEAGQVDFDVGFDAGAGAFETVEAQEFVGDELEVAGGLERDEFAQEGDGGLGPGGALVAAAGVDVECLAVSEPAGAKLVEAGFAYMEELAGLGGIDVAGVEGLEGLLDEVEGMAVDELALFISAIDRILGRLGIPIFARFLAGSLPRPALRSGLLRAPAKKRVKCDFHAKCTFPLLFRFSSLLNRRGQFFPILVFLFMGGWGGGVRWLGRLRASRGSSKCLGSRGIGGVLRAGCGSLGLPEKCKIRRVGR